MDDHVVNYSDDQLELVQKISSSHDHYIILGVDKNSPIEDIRKAYKKLSLKVHPDKNKVPGAEEAFKAISNAFQSLSKTNLTCGKDQEQEDRDGISSDREFKSHQHRILRSLGGFRLLALLLQFLPMILLFLVCYFPCWGPNYALQSSESYQYGKFTNAHGVPFWVKLEGFDEGFPPRSSARIGIEIQVERDYMKILRHYCGIEMQRCEWGLAFEAPHCDKLQQLKESSLFSRMYMPT